MADSATALTRIKRLIRAAVVCQQNRGLLLVTHDFQHALGLLKHLAHEDPQTALFRFSPAGRFRYQPEQGRFEVSGADEQDLSRLLRSVLETKHPAVVVIESVLSLVREQGGDHVARFQAQELFSAESGRGGRLLIFLETPEGCAHLPASLRPQVEEVQLSLPRVEDLERLVIQEGAAMAQLTNTALEPETLRQHARRLAESLVGLTISAARNALRDALMEARHDFDAAARVLREQKANRLGQELSMRVLERGIADFPIGLDYLGDFLRVHRGRIGVPGPDRAKGILLVGPPGTGKSMMARAIGEAVELPVVEFLVGALMDKYLGETEHRFRRAFEIFDAMAPTVIFCDEFEKAFAGQGTENDGGTMLRAKGALLTWLSDSNAPNFLVGTSNNLEVLGEMGPALSRRGRFDRIFYVGNPCRAAREQILRQLLKDQVPEEAVETLATQAAAETRHFSGADLRAIVTEAKAQAAYHGEPLTFPHLLEQVKKNKLRVQALHERFSRLRDWARLHCEPAGPSADEEIE